MLQSNGPQIYLNIIGGLHIFVVVKGPTLRVPLGGSGQTNFYNADVGVDRDQVAHLQAQEQKS